MIKFRGENMTQSSPLFWGMKLVELLLYIIFNGTNYSKVVSAEPPDGEWLEAPG